MSRAQVISFDMDGTLTDLSFVNSVWLQGLPELYAVKNKISFKQALNHVESDFGKVGKHKLEWYDLGYWLEKYELDKTPEELLNSFVERIQLFEEVPRVLEKLKNLRFRLIVVTNARREFVDLEMERAGLRGFFERIFSSTSDFNLTKNGTVVYEKVCVACGVTPNNLIHIGDDPIFDFKIPKKLGIRAFLLDRSRKKTGSAIFSNLDEFVASLSFLT